MSESWDNDTKYFGMLISPGLKLFKDVITMTNYLQ